MQCPLKEDAALDIHSRRDQTLHVATSFNRTVRQKSVLQAAAVDATFNPMMLDKINGFRRRTQR
jgi:hypothetical protein